MTPSGRARLLRRLVQPGEKWGLIDRKAYPVSTFVIKLAHTLRLEQYRTARKFWDTFYVDCLDKQDGTKV